MSKEVESYSLPISSVDLCFDGNAFVQPYFSADRFLQEQRGRASLETMRDDLGSYLKVLRSATLDLIDHDYADFVGLSSSLVGLDKAVGKIRDPLGQLREEVMAVKSSLEEALRGVKLQLEERRSLRVKRSMLEASLQALKSLQLLESLLSEDNTCASWRGSCVEDEKSHELAVAERSGAGCNQLQFCLEKCDPVDQLKLRASSARSKLMQLLEAMLLALLAGRDVGSTSGNSALVRLLRLYASLNETAVAEDLVGEHVVAPALDAIMRKPSLAEGGGRHGQLLSEIYRQALSVVAEKLGRLLALTSSSEERHLSVDGFDFLANSFWPQFVHQLEVNLPNIYAPGNPDVFHQRYCETMLFLEELEKFSGSETAVKRLRSKPSYQHFLRSWNLKVYFQIRFQELAGFVESAFPAQPYPSRGFDGSTAGSLLGLSTSRPCHGGFWLAPTNTCWECIDRCWHGNTFIGRVGHMFWKMSLQFVARYSLWSRDILEHQLRSVQPEDVRPSTVGSSEVVVEEQSVSEQSGDGVPMPGPLLLLPLCLHRDVCQLSERLERHLLPRATSALTAAATNTTTSCHQHQAIDSLLKRSLDDGLQALRSNVEPLALRCVVDIIARWSLPHLRQCRDIPRLYRRTNRVHPTRPRPYVSSALAPALHFRSLVLASFSSPPPNNKAQPLHDTTPWVDAALLTHIMVLIFSEITLQYHSGVLEVLTSVHKMEESLRRLKRIRAAPSDGEAPSSAADDDEKIRAQLALDVHHFCRQIECAGVQRNEVKQLLELVELVDNATSRVNARSQ